jgi:hypothetical protein
VRALDTLIDRRHYHLAVREDRNTDVVLLTEFLGVWKRRRVERLVRDAIYQTARAIVLGDAQRRERVYGDFDLHAHVAGRQRRHGHRRFVKRDVLDKRAAIDLTADVKIDVTHRRDEVVLDAARGATGDGAVEHGVDGVKRDTDTVMSVGVAFAASQLQDSVRKHFNVERLARARSDLERDAIQVKFALLRRAACAPATPPTHRQTVARLAALLVLCRENERRDIVHGHAFEERRKIYTT